MEDISRREAITRIATGTAGLGLVTASGELVTASQTSTADTTPARAFRGQHQSLAFDPTKLKGLSEKLIRSHWENNYGGAETVRKSASSLPNEAVNSTIDPKLRSGQIHFARRLLA